MQRAVFLQFGRAWALWRSKSCFRRMQFFSSRMNLYGVCAARQNLAGAFCVGVAEETHRYIVESSAELELSVYRILAGFPFLTETTHGFAQANRERRDGFEPLLRS